MEEEDEEGPEQFTRSDRIWMVILYLMVIIEIAFGILESAIKWLRNPFPKMRELEKFMEERNKDRADMEG